MSFHISGNCFINSIPVLTTLSTFKTGEDNLFISSSCSCIFFFKSSFAFPNSSVEISPAILKSNNLFFFSFNPSIFKLNFCSSSAT
ncbi:MAG TPA: hypothetical protein PKZ36_00270 [Candidatus Paceibacterota bacterium]|nr:hypothetical protein [Candidatus Paceibacterota bacterium]HPT17837.1 hypothetical protein [Candidatus Paceibacterota bacterium]